MGVDRHAVSRGLKALETATLVRVERRDGRAVVVTILDTPAIT
jgi:DNA-binding MarR family transcriptional regulator